MGFFMRVLTYVRPFYVLSLLLLALLSSAISIPAQQHVDLDHGAWSNAQPGSIPATLSRRFDLDNMKLEELQPLRPVVSKRADDPSLGDVLALAWSSPTAVATLTALFNGSKERVVNMDAFSSVVSAVDCTAPELSLDFVDQAAFLAAIAAWDWVGEHEDHHFVMVVDSPHCGTTAGWVPYNITAVRYDTEEWIAYLAATEIDFVDAIRHGSLTIEITDDDDDDDDEALALLETIPESAPAPTSPTLSPRRTGSSRSVNLAHTFSGKIVNVPLPSGDDASSSLHLECESCSTSGTATTRFDVEIAWFHIKRAALTITARNVISDISFSLGAAAAHVLSGTTPVFSYELVGVSIPGIAKFGFGPELGITWAVDTAGSGGVGWGVRGVATPRSTATLCFVGCDTDSRGWDMDWSSPALPRVSGSIGVDVDVATYLTLAAGVSLFGYGYEGGVALEAPSFRGNVSAMANPEDGECGAAADGTVLGLRSTLLVGTNAFAYYGQGRDETDRRWDLASSEHPLVDHCLPIGGA